jgi:hypothetical protein
MLTYGSEIWGYENTKHLEKLHLQFCRNILGVRTTTPNFMTYGELDRTPIDTLCIKLRIVNFWNKLIITQCLSSDRAAEHGLFIYIFFVTYHLNS